MKRKVSSLGHFVDRQKLPLLATPKVGVENNRPCLLYTSDAADE